MDQRRPIEQAKFTYSPLGKALEKQTKTIEDQGNKQVKAIDDYGKNWLNLMNFLRRILILTDSIPFEEQKRYLMNLLKKGRLNLRVYKQELILMI